MYICFPKYQAGKDKCLQAGTDKSVAVKLG